MAPGSQSDQTYPPPIQYAETALLPKFLEPPDAPPSMAELAHRNGLRPAATRPRFWSYVAQLWRFRQFTATYANGRAAAKYGRARLGRFWQIVSPIVNAGIYYVIFGFILRTQRGIDNFVVYLCIGMFLYTFLQSVATSGVSAITGQMGLLRAMHFPRASLPFAVTMTQIQNFMGSVAVLVAIVFVFGERFVLKWLYLLPTLALLVIFAFGLALLLARVGTKLPDVRQLMPYAMRVWMYTSGVFFNVEVFAANLPKWLVPIVEANPLLVYIELARYSLMDHAPLASTPSELWIKGAAWALIMLVVGFVYFWRGEAEYGRD